MPYESRGCDRGMCQARAVLEGQTVRETSEHRRGRDDERRARSENRRPTHACSRCQVDIGPAGDHNARAFKTGRVRKWDPHGVRAGSHQAFHVIQPGRFHPHQHLADVRMCKRLDGDLKNVGSACPLRICHASFQESIRHALIMQANTYLCQLAFMLKRAAPRRLRLSPRKRPQQERSRETVEAILQAATDILVRQGAGRLTTNRIAERAGVNIASLYQYFPGKHAIIAELRRRHGEEQRGAVRQVLIERRRDDLEPTLRALVSMGVAAHAVNPELQRVFSQELPQLRYADISAADAPLFDEFRALLARSATGIRDPDLAMWMTATVSDAVIHRAVVERPDDVSNGSIADELVTLLVRYLKRSAR
jgi:AcrR family transcriptional regulator